MDLKVRRQKDYSAKFHWGGDKKKMWIKLRMMTDEERQKIVKDATVVHIDFPLHPKTGKMQRVETREIDEKKLMEALVDSQLVEWGNFTLEGKELDCTLENKLSLIENVDGFAQFYAESITALKKDSEEAFGGTSASKN